MNTLSNGSIAVGSEGSWMRFQAAYEYELQQAYEKGIVRLKAEETISTRAITMLEAIIDKRATAGDAMKRAAKACGIKPTEKAIVDYLKAAKRS